MALNETKEKVRSYILHEFLPGEDPGQLTDDLPLISGRILDSLATLKLVAHIEDTFGVEFAAHEVGPENLDTVALITAFVESKRTAGKP
jgi:acyl carrier protein